MVSMIWKVIKNFFSKVFTTEYPKKEPKISKHFRGNLRFDYPKCIGCLLCEKNCPTGAIKVNAKEKIPYIDHGLCILCTMCREVCPTKCIYFSDEYKIGKEKRKDLRTPQTGVGNKIKQS